MVGEKEKRSVPDQEIVCVDCQQPFNFSERDQEFFESKGFSPPKRCKACRANKAQSGSRSAERVAVCCPGMGELVRRKMMKAAGTHPLLVVHFGKQETLQVSFCPCCGKNIQVGVPEK